MAFIHRLPVRRRERPRALLPPPPLPALFTDAYSQQTITNTISHARARARTNKLLIVTPFQSRIRGATLPDRTAEWAKRAQQTIGTKSN